jgi:hypothetical protein
LSVPAERYGVDELAAAAQLLGAPLFPGTNGALSTLDPDARDAALRSARRSLLARGALEIDDEGVLSVAAPHALLFRVALAPELVVTAGRRARSGAESRSFYLLPDVAVEHSIDVGRVHVLTRFEPGQLLERVSSFVGLADATAGDGSFTATGEELDEALRAGANGEPVALPPEAEAFTSAISERTRLLRVDALHRDGARIVGGELSWIEAGDVWLVEPAGEGTFAVRGAAPGELIAELLSYLPGAAPPAE